MSAAKCCCGVHNACTGLSLQARVGLVLLNGGGDVNGVAAPPITIEGLGRILSNKTWEQQTMAAEANDGIWFGGISLVLVVCITAASQYAVFVSAGRISHQ